VTADALIARAESACDKGIVYGLGKGGYWPLDKLPCRVSARKVDGKVVKALWCDCSGFIAWLIGYARSRTIVPGMWGISTDSIHADATGKQVLFERIDKPEAGCIMVYPDHDGHQGHVALLVDPLTWTIIDCSFSQKGIRKHVGLYWKTTPNVVCCRVKEAG